MVYGKRNPYKVEKRGMRWSAWHNAGELHRCLKLAIKPSPCEIIRWGKNTQATRSNILNSSLTKTRFDFETSKFCEGNFQFRGVKHILNIPTVSLRWSRKSCNFHESLLRSTTSFAPGSWIGGACHRSAVSRQLVILWNLLPGNVVYQDDCKTFKHEPFQVITREGGDEVYTGWYL